MFKLFLEILPLALAFVALVMCIARGRDASTVLARGLTSAGMVCCVILLIAQVIGWLPGSELWLFMGEPIRTSLWVLFNCLVMVVFAVGAYRLKE